jgi:hypothetical protein
MHQEEISGTYKYMEKNRKEYKILNIKPYQ